MLQPSSLEKSAPAHGEAAQPHVDAYWRAWKDFEAASERDSRCPRDPAAEKAVYDALARSDAALAALGTLAPSDMREAAAMQVVALDCCDRGDWTEIVGGHLASANILRRVAEALKLWSEAASPLLA